MRGSEGQFCPPMISAKTKVTAAEMLIELPLQLSKRRLLSTLWHHGSISVDSGNTQ